MKKMSAVFLACAMLASCGANPTSSGGNGEKVVKIFANFPTAEAEKGDKAVFEKVEQALGLKIQFEVPPSTNYKERLQLMLVSGEYPDLVMFPSVSDESYRNAVKSKVVVPVNEYLNEAPNIMKYTYDMSWKGLKTEKDDNIYGIPRTSISRSDGFLVRGDWMKNVGIAIPEDSTMTIEEFTDMLDKFTNNDPDGNGINDTYGFAGAADAKKQFILPLGSQFGLLGWQEYPGEDSKYMNLMYSRKSDNYKRALSYAQDLFKRKLMDPDSPVNTVKTASERFKRGLCGVVTEFSGWAYGYQKDMVKTFPELDLTYIYVRGEDGQLKGSVSSTGFWGFWSLMKGSKEPEAAISVLDYLLSDDGWEMVINGVEGVHYVKEGDQIIEAEDVVKDWAKAMVRRKDAKEFFVSNTLPNGWYEKTNRWVELGIESAFNSLAGDFAPEITRDARYLEYEMTMSEVLTKIMTGYEKVEAYDALLDGWYKNGGEQYVQEMNDYIEGK